MSEAKIVIPDAVKQFVENITAENGIEKWAKIKYQPGSELFDGYTSETFIVDVSDGKKSLNLFLKVPLSANWQENLPTKKIFDNETYFYGTIYPAYEIFLKEHGIEDGFRNVPKCYGANNNMIALDNLKKKHFCMLGKGRELNDAHFSFTVKTFAKFHAISFALKDQKTELYENFKRNIHACNKDVMVAAGFDKYLIVMIKEFLRKLDPAEDKYILDVSGDLVEKLSDIMLTIENHSNDYSTITQGDCWTNNMMYLYEEGKEECPIDMMLVDWQLLRNGSPAIDLAYFFYSISSESTLDNLEHYMKVYHEELSKRIRQLGSEPDVLYPYRVFKEEWKKFAKYGLAMAFLVMIDMLMEKSEMPNMDEFPELFEKLLNDDEEALMPKMKNEDLYQSRMKMILKHFIENDFL